nr:hypothetical protein [Mammaliicoccus sp. Marseille-Q6498]
MNKMTKLTVATGISIGALFGTVGISDGQSNTAEAAVTPYYNYSGYTGYDGSFVLDSTFINALAYKNVTMNGTRIVQPQSDEGAPYIKKKVYDQTFFFHKDNNSSYALSVKFPVKKNNISKAQMIKAYGNNYNIEETSHGKEYRYPVGFNLIIFTVVDDHVTEVNIGENLGSR